MTQTIRDMLFEGMDPPAIALAIYNENRGLMTIACDYCGRPRKGICNTCRKVLCASHWELHHVNGHDVE